MNRRSLGVALLLLVLALVACGQSVNVDEPPTIVYGQDVCDRCGMIINEERFAAAYWTEEGQARRFDDIGGMLAGYQETGDAVAAFWVHDYLSGDWLQGEDAYYVLGVGLTTPMGFGIAANSTQEQADSLAYGHETAQVLDFSSLMARIESGELNLAELVQHGEEMHDHEAAMDMDPAADESS